MKLDLDSVMSSADFFYSEMKEEKGMGPRGIESDQIKALARALVEEINCQPQIPEQRRCYVSSLQKITPDPEFPNRKKWTLVEDREFTWTFHAWGVDYSEDGQYSVAIVEAECGKVSMVRADWIRLLP